MVWQAVIASSANPGLVWSESPEGFGPALQAPLDQTSEPVSNAHGFLCALTDHSVLKVTGADADSFLQGQFTNDVAAIGDGQAQRTGLCSPKGRLLTDFLAIRDAQGLYLVMANSLADTIRKRLSMYVMRAKVTIEDVTATLLPFGCVATEKATPGPASADWPGLLTIARDPDNRLSAGLESVTTGDSYWQRMLLLIPAATVEQDLVQWRDLWPLAPTRWWYTGEALAGTARISAPTSDAFVPQMINFELVGGVSFTKGCFPGQEIVARTQYLGKLKRRLFMGWVSAQANAAPGTDVLGADDAPIGMVLLSGPGLPVGLPDQQVFLFETRLASVSDEAPPKLAEHQVTIAPLPYEIPVAERFIRPDL